MLSARVSVASSRLHVPQRNTGIERSHHERATKHVRVNVPETRAVNRNRSNRSGTRSNFIDDLDESHNYHSGIRGTQPAGALSVPIDGKTRTCATGVRGHPGEG